MRALVISVLFLAGCAADGSDAGAILGGALGGATGAAIGQEIGGQSGAVIGGAVGGATGAAMGGNRTVRSEDGERDRYRGRGHRRDDEGDDRED